MSVFASTRVRNGSRQTICCIQSLHNNTFLGRHLSLIISVGFIILNNTHTLFAYLQCRFKNKFINAHGIEITSYIFN